ncbi:choline dehydrogenase [Rhodobacteraceae bacterium W635]|uniref:GMC family oxidoreductase n=1 Tax=Nioella halotolerans TaxID=2303578 RepID=UPI000E3E98DE|nr:choline dehydrogenase [Rhodobacteraceae bacterium W635]
MDEVDYVIVGAGSAGCVMANRLSANGRHRVLLLEAGGGDARLWIKVPVGYAMTFADPKLNWGYVTEADAGLSGRRIYWPRGRVIGGSSSINAMAYVRGQPRDFDDWAAAGAQGWGWSQVQDTYDTMETRAKAASRAERGGDGPVWVQDLSDQMHPFSRNFLHAGRGAGFALVDDMNLSGADGLGFYRSTVRHGLRWSSADAFLRPATRRGNLRIVTRAQVTGLEVRGGQVTGLAYIRHGRMRRVRARKEVILCAGAINTPHLLQLSGIGPADVLKAHGIKVRHHLAYVGQGLQDHLAVSYQFRARVPTLNSLLGRPIGRLRAALRYVLTRRGALSVPVNQVGGFVRSSPDRVAPDVQLFCNPASYEIDRAGKVVLDRLPGYILSAQPCRPTSRGHVRIASASWRDAPVIQPNSLATEEDRAAAVRASKVIRALARTPHLQKVTVAAKTPAFDTMDDSALLDAFRSRASTVYHPSCTCRMGHGPQDSVLNARLQVHGMAGLRVVDASAFPNITSGNINAPTMMLAMRAADMVLQDAG